MAVGTEFPLNRNLQQMKPPLAPILFKNGNPPCPEGNLSQQEAAQAINYGLAITAH
jgi:hypothetical protein